MSDLPDSWREILSRVDGDGMIGVEVGPGEMEYFSPEELMGIEEEPDEECPHIYDDEKCDIDSSLCVGICLCPWMW